MAGSTPPPTRLFPGMAIAHPSDDGFAPMLTPMWEEDSKYHPVVGDFQSEELDDATVKECVKSVLLVRDNSALAIIFLPPQLIDAFYEG